MDAYKVISLVGEGSFGRVYKAKRRDTKEVVALKVIRKCGRTPKELLSLRSECKIQKHLHHRNIIQMINSFETDNEIVVVTEFCKRDLHCVLSKQSYLSEDVALPIVCDLVAALHYLHSNRVLHRDLKPQNVLVTQDGTAKLCDFGFARSMSNSTHVLTSIKGTPLYMAPELIEESPYDHNADLWSLGCIVYEMMVGVPPFTTTSILQLVRMIRYDTISWPAYLSNKCQNMLQGLLQKNPAQRLSWPHLLHHPFLQNKVSSSIESGITLPLTKELSSSQALAKENQKLDLAHKTDIQNQRLPQKIQQVMDVEKKLVREGACQTQAHPEPEGGAALIDLEALEQKLSQLKATEQQSEVETDTTTQDETSETTDDDSVRATTPLETEEWLAFLQQSMREVMVGDFESISEKSFITMVTNALTNHGATPKVSEYIACLLALPHVAPGVTKSDLATITSVYMEVKVVSSLMYALKLLTHGPACSNSHDSVVEATKLSRDQLTAIERMMVLLNQLVHWDPVFLSQLCDVVTLLHLCPRFHLLLTLHKVRPRISVDIVAILTHILRQMPENASIVDDSLHSEFSTGLNWYKMVKFANRTLQTRLCVLFQLMSQHCTKTFKTIWTPKMKKYMEGLVYDSMMNLRCAAEELLEVVQDEQLEELVTQESSNDVEEECS